MALPSFAVQKTTNMLGTLEKSTNFPSFSVVSAPIFTTTNVPTLPETGTVKGASQRLNVLQDLGFW